MERLPFGLINAPVVIQRFTENCLEGYRGQLAASYLDDVLVDP